MSLIQALILGTIQGLTEFIPVSSSGHLVLLHRLFGITEGTLTFTIFVHLGSLLAIFVVFFEDILHIVKNPFDKLPLLLLTGAVVTGAIGLAFSGFFRSIFETGQTIGINFILTGLVLFSAEKIRRGEKEIAEMTHLDASFIGFMQSFAIMPAISRSGMTIVGALFRGMDRIEAARYSFLLSIPVILGASLLEIREVYSGALLESINTIPILAGTVSAAIASYFAIKYMLKVLTKGSLAVFSYYVFALGVFVLIDQFFFQAFFPSFF